MIIDAPLSGDEVDAAHDAQEEEDEKEEENEDWEAEDEQWEDEEDEEEDVLPKPMRYWLLVDKVDSAECSGARDGFFPVYSS
jgi:hypothetical protein